MYPVQRSLTMEPEWTEVPEVQAGNLNFVLSLKVEGYEIVRYDFASQVD